MTMRSDFVCVCVCVCVCVQEGGGEEEDLEDTLTTDTLSPEDSNSSEEQPLNKQVCD
jgi:hypothetical protein